MSFLITSALSYFYPRNVLNIKSNSKNTANTGCPLCSTNSSLNTDQTINFVKKLNTKILQIYSSYLKEDGHSVDYKGVEKSEDWKEYEHQITHLNQLDLKHLSNSKKKAFFLNIYNCLVIHGQVVVSTTQSFSYLPSPLRIYSFFSSFAYQIGQYTYTLDEIEHAILRGNSKTPGTGEVLFLENDPRINYIIPKEEVDPRIHFALVCGAKSCPAIRIYDSKNIEQGLDLAARSFCTSNISFQSPNIFRLSQIFQWYTNDFGTTQKEVLRFISKYLDQSSNEWKQIDHFTNDHNQSDENMESFKIEYEPYDWTLNSI